MCPQERLTIICAMVRPLTASKLLLIADRRSAPSQPHSSAVRRYRLARLALEGRPPAASRFEHLKRTYD
jgi:hypothetical protein